MLELLAGTGGAEIIHLGVRVTAGTFFAISGYHKLFNRERHAGLVSTLQEDKVPFVGLNQWFVPSVEFLGGTALIVGFLTPLAAAGLAVICIVACFVDGIRRVPSMKPIDAADYVDDVLYLPEVIYVGLLLYCVAAGAGPLSVDNLLLSFLR